MRSGRVLVWMKANYLGDAVLATPLLDALLAKERQLAVLAGKPVIELLACRAPSLEFIEAGPLVSVRPVLREARRLRQMRFDIAVLVNRSFRSALAARLAGIPVRVGFATEGRRSLLTHAVPYLKTRPETECFLDLARALGLNPTDSIPRLCVSEAEAAAGARLLEGATVGFQPGARYGRKQVPADTLAAVAEAVREAGEKIALFGGKEERRDAARFQTLLREEAVCLVGKTTVRETMGALAGLKLMVGSDTGLLHIAAGLGCPTVTVFGPTSSVKWGHDYPPHRILVAERRDMSTVSPQALVHEVLDALRSPALRTE